MQLNEKNCLRLSKRKIMTLNQMFKFKKLGVFSKSNCGNSSEESRIVKAWHDLIEEAQIIDTKQVIQDFDNLLKEQWPCNAIYRNQAK